MAFTGFLFSKQIVVGKIRQHERKPRYAFKRPECVVRSTSYSNLYLEQEVLYEDLINYDLG